LRARTARIGDAAAVHRMIAHYAGEGLLLPRTEAEIREHIARFLVLVEKRADEEKVLGCVALEPYGPDLAEVRSLAVSPDARGQGRNVGDRLMKAAMDTARRRKIARLFAVTHRPEFFSRYGFTPGPRQTVPEKIERDCVTCSKERKCDLIATVAVICPERDLLPVLNGAGKVFSVA
jgi:amino-acid N-acetyltransferase